MSVFTVRFIFARRLQCLKVTTDYVPNVCHALANFKLVKIPAIRRTVAHLARNSDNLQRIICADTKFDFMTGSIHV